MNEEKYYRVTFTNNDYIAFDDYMSFTCMVKAKNEQDAVESARTYWLQNARVVEIEEENNVRSEQ